jgi:hypothetical protein
MLYGLTLPDVKLFFCIALLRNHLDEVGYGNRGKGQQMY